MTVLCKTDETALEPWRMWDLWLWNQAAVMTNTQCALFQATAFDSLYDPTATLHSPCAEVVSRSFQITPIPIKATSSNLMHPRAEEDDINKLAWRANIKLLSGWEVEWREKKIFFPLLMEPSTITFSREMESQGGWRFCGPRQRGSIITIENITANGGHPGHQRWSSHKFHALYNRPVTLEGWSENNAHGWFLSSSVLLLITAK